MADTFVKITFYCLVEVLLTENRAQNKIEYHQETMKVKQRETLTNEQARERIAMDCSCHKHAR